MDLNAAMIFVRVIRFGSFSKAALDLKLPKSTVSDRISDLEKDLGVKLLVRTTRKLRPTDAGTTFFKKAEVAISALQDAGEEASLFQKRPSGTLKITGPAELDFVSVCDAAIEYRAKFPDVKVELLLTNRVVDMIGEGIDIAIRAAQLKDLSFTSKRLGSSGFILVASPKYLQNSSVIRQPSHVLAHKCLVITPENGAKNETIWKLISSSGKKATIEPPTSVTSNSVEAIKHLALIGEGIALLPPTLVHEEILKRRLIQVLPEWSTSSRPVYLLYAAHKNSSPKLREMIPLLEPRLRRFIK